MPPNLRSEFPNSSDEGGFDERHTVMVWTARSSRHDIETRGDSNSTGLNALAEFA